VTVLVSPAGDRILWLELVAGLVEKASLGWQLWDLSVVDLWDLNAEFVHLPWQNELEIAAGGH
jgi:hypothetical protein